MGFGDGGFMGDDPRVGQNGSLEVEKSTRNIQKSWEVIGKLPVVSWMVLWWLHM